MGLQVEDDAFFGFSDVAGLFSISFFRSTYSFFSCCCAGYTNGYSVLPVEGYSFPSTCG